MFLLTYGIFAGFVVTYIILKNLSIIKSNPSYVTILTYTFYLCILLNHFFFSYYGVSASVCGEPQFTTTLIHMAPWSLFFIILGILAIIPAWKEPFSNTLGYAILHLPLINIKKLFLKMLAKDSSNSTLQRIISAPSLTINAITPENFDIMYKALSGSFNSSAGQYKDQLRNLVDLKDDISKGVWMLLVGALSTIVSYTGISKEECSNSERYMRNQINKSEELIDVALKDEKKAKYIQTD